DVAAEHAEAEAWGCGGYGFVGTYLGLDAPATVTVILRAAGRGTPGCPRVAVVTGDARTAIEVDAGVRDHRVTFALPAGTHFLRVEVAGAACRGGVAISQ